MNNDILEGNWKQLKGNILEQWGKLTDDDLDVAEGKRDQLAGKIQEKYGLAKDAAEKQISDFEDRLKGSMDADVDPVCPRCGLQHVAGAPCPNGPRV